MNIDGDVQIVFLQWSAIPNGEGILMLPLNVLFYTYY